MKETQEKIAMIRKLIKAQVPTVSVRNGRGTAWGWIEVTGSGKWGEFTEAEREGLKALGLTPGGNFANISPESRDYWLGKLAGLSLKDRRE